MDEFSLQDPSQLIEATSDFASYPGVQNDASAKNFLDRFPLPVIISALQSNSDVPGLESTLVACLERIFKTKYGASLIPQYMSFIQVGLRADSQIVRCLACKTVSCLLEHDDKVAGSAAQLVTEYDIYPCLLDNLINGDELVATASMDAIKSLASSPKGIDIIFPANGDDATHLRNVAARSSSLGRIRVLALIVKLFSVSSSVASIIYNSNLLNLLEAEVSSKNDMLMTLSVLELLYELSEIPHGAKFLSRTTLLQLLTSLISNTSAESILRSRAIMISGRLLSSEDIFSIVEISSVKTLLSAIDERLEFFKGQDTDECESALEALGQIGSCNRGAALLLSNSSPVARHVVDAAFDRQGRGRQLAALHALGNISGENRSEDSKLLNDVAEECLRQLIYETAGESPKLTPSGLFLSVLRQDSEVRLAAYRLITGLVARPWCLQQICSKREIIDIVTDAYIESTKNGMEARYNCCKAIHKALSASNRLLTDPALSGIGEKLQEAVRRGPYLARDRIEAQPAVVTADRF
ncbi:26S proteasome non-ATPase regulatory subunit 5 [Macleaya cordata]|uniref:26S proteasome non-ATPase regulatory subunit 5 n=1 Tax=Macleaya cordata TaxID=56857 RepID=A0A200QM10_MACCD|nr:26S proteasome non-ATPase regulatory subunit 5 [Macleaya cordata]